MPNLISWGWQLRGNIPLASERFRSVPRTLRPLFGRLIVRRSMRVVCAPEEIRHERAGCSGETAFGFRQHGAMNPAGRARCNMRKQIELGRGECNFHRLVSLDGF